MTRDNVERKQARTEEERMEDEGTFKIIFQIVYVVFRLRGSPSNRKLRGKIG